MAQLTFREKAGFSCGEIGGSGLAVIVSTFLAAYYTDTFGLEASAVATIFLTVRVFDALLDPLMGVVADRTRTRWGRFRPYLLWMGPFYGVGMLALFFGPNLGPNGRLIYAYASYIFVMLVYTAIMIPFSALSGVLTTDAKDRNSLNTYRFFTAFVISMILQASLKPAVRYFGSGNEAVGFRWILLIFVLLAVPGYLIAFASTREPPQSKANQVRSSIWQDLKDLLRSRAWVTIVVVCVLLWIFFAIRGSVRLYYFKYYMNDEYGVSAFMFTGTVFTLLGVLITPWLTRFIDKKPLFILSLVLSAGFSIAHYWIRPGDLKALYALQILMCLSGGPLMPVIWSMMADAGDEFEYVRGRGAMGLVYSASTLALKSGDALGAAASLYLLAWHGFKANQVQNDHVQEALRGMMSFYPAIGYGICALCLLPYPLNRAKLLVIENELRARRTAAAS